MRVRSVCGHCRQPIQLTIDSDLRVKLDDPAAAPLVFRPDVDWARLEDPSIIHAF